jgi:hypothetical protein
MGKGWCVAEGIRINARREEGEAQSSPKRALADNTMQRNTNSLSHGLILGICAAHQLTKGHVGVALTGRAQCWRLWCSWLVGAVDLKLGAFARH